MTSEKKDASRARPILLVAYVVILSVLAVMYIFSQDPFEHEETQVVSHAPAPRKSAGKLTGYWIDLPESKKPVKAGKTRQEWLVGKTGTKKDIAEKIVSATKKYDHGDLLLALLTVESDARPNLKRANNYGLCQVSTVHFGAEEQKRIRRLGYKTIKDCGVRSPDDLYDIGKNICAANAIFERILKEADGNYALALKKYNANPRHKHRYSRKVMRRYREIQRLQDA